MKTLLLTGLGLAIAFSSLKAQNDSTRIREFGIGLTNFNSFNLQYQWGTQKTLYRFSAASISFSDQKNTNTSSSDSSAPVTTSTNYNPTINANLMFAVLKIKKVAAKFDFLCGPIIGFGFQYSKITNGSSYAYTPFAGIAIGARYAISPSFLLYAEIDPRLFYTYSKATNNYNGPAIDAIQNTNTSFGVSNLANSGASLTLVYRWHSPVHTSKNG